MAYSTFTPRFSYTLSAVVLLVCVLTFINIAWDYDYLLVYFPKDFVSGALFGLNAGGSYLSFYVAYSNRCRQREESQRLVGCEKS